MIDPINLRLIENAQDFFVQDPAGLGILPERLLDNHASPRFFALGLCQPRFAKLFDNPKIDVRWRRKIKEAVAVQLAFAIEFLQSLGEAGVRLGIVVTPAEV